MSLPKSLFPLFYNPCHPWPQFFKIRSLPFSPYLSLWYCPQNALVPGNWHKLWQPTLTLTWSMHTSFYSSLNKSGHLYLKTFTTYTLFFYSEFLFYFFIDISQGLVYFGFQISVTMTGETDLTRKKNWIKLPPFQPKLFYDSKYLEISL